MSLVDGAVGLVVPDELPMPELEPVDGAVGLVVLPEELPMPEDEPEPALPELLRASVWHLSRSAPVRPTHLLASLPDAPDAAPVVPDVDVLVSVELEDDAPVDGSVELPDELLAGGVAEGVVALPEDELPLDGEVVLLPDEPAPALPELPMPVLPLLEPEDWANAAPERASNAAAVAAVSVFNII